MSQTKPKWLLIFEMSLAVFSMILPTLLEITKPVQEEKPVRSSRKSKKKR